jgi:glycosyltransferase involved in cell wall biosynthesis
VRIGIDATSIPPQPAGAGVYAIELVRALAERDRRDGYAVFTRGPWFDGMTDERKNWRIERVSAGSRGKRAFWEQAQLPGALERLGIDVLHSTHHTLPLRPMRARKVVTVHDVTFFRMPERYPPLRRAYMQTMTRLSARAAEHVVVPSETIKRDVGNWLGIDASRVSVVYEAASEIYRPVAHDSACAVARGYGIDGPYVLSVGSREPGKNRVRLVRALAALRDEGIDCALLVIGQGAWGYEQENDVVRELGMQDRVRFAGYAPIEDLPSLHSAAAAFAFPSLYEGFGLPVLEAMACGAPVLTSNLSATAEVAGDAALLVDPLSVEAIRDGLRALLTDEALRRKLAAAGLARSAGFSWRRAADETFTVYERAMQERTGNGR